MIKNIHDSLKQTLLNLYNKIFLKCDFPPRWRLAIVIPIQKPNKDSTDPNNYRPISLTNCMCKIIERIINNRLVSYLESRNLFSPYQSGFRHNRSSTDNLMILDSAIHSAIEKKQHSIAIFFDLTKAYDTAWKYNILKQLHSFGMRGNLPLFIKEFLTDRKIQVRVGNTLSPEKSVEEGIPQGSVLSCTCFAIAINNICEELPNNVSKCLYVDDFALFASGSSTNTIERRLQLAINKLETWCHKTGFQFSTVKTASLHICRKKTCPKTAANLKLNGTPINNVSSFKYLGMTYDNSFTWRPHITKLKASCNKTIDLLKHLSHKKWGADRKSLLSLYIMLIKPKIDYGIETYASTAKTYKNSINAIQNSAIRIATGAFKSSPITSLHAESGIKPYKYFSDIKHLNYLIRVSANPSHPLHQKYTEYTENPNLSRTKELCLQYA